MIYLQGLEVTGKDILFFLFLCNSFENDFNRHKLLQVVCYCVWWRLQSLMCVLSKYICVFSIRKDYVQRWKLQWVCSVINKIIKWVMVFCSYVMKIQASVCIWGSHSGVRFKGEFHWLLIPFIFGPGMQFCVEAH